MRAKLPVEEGTVERDGVKLHYEVYGEGAETIVFVPPWSIVHSRVYKASGFAASPMTAEAMANPTGRTTWRPIR
jgi:hypothetical protein